MNLLTPCQLVEQFYPEIAPVGQVTPVPVSGFSGAAVFRVETGTMGPLCLRQWPTEPMTIPRLAGIHGLQRAVNRAGLSVVPVPVLTGQGESFLEWEGHLWQMESWMPGQADFRDSPSEARLESAMTTLARFHLAAREASPESASADCPPTLPERLRILRNTRRQLSRLEQGVLTEPDDRFRGLAMQIGSHFREHAARIEFSLRHSSRQPVPVQPCLRDVWHDHLLFTGDELTGLVDFGAVRIDTVSADLSRLLASLFADADVAGWETALSHYETIRPLTDAERRLIPILDESGTLLSGTYWLRTRYVDQAAFDLQRVCDRLEVIADRLEFLASRRSA